MFLSNASIKRPVAMGCLLIAFALLGFNAFRRMNLELMPQVDVPFITIATVYPGAAPEEIETDIARRIEDAVASVDGLRHSTTYSMENVCRALLEFELGVDVDVAAMDVREQIDLIRADLPDGAHDPIILKVDIGATPVLTLGLVGDVGIDELYDYADRQLRDRLFAVRGVADVALIGGAEREVQILLDRDALAARGITATHVVQAVRTGVGTIPAGRIRDNGTEYTVTFRAEYDRIEDLEELEIVAQDGHRVTLGDVGRVVMGMAELRQIAELDGRPAIAINIVKRADANAVQVIRLVEQTIAELQDELPAGMQLVSVTDERSITEAMSSGAWLNVVQGVLMTGAILFFFLYNIRTLFIVALTMPATIVIGLFFIQASDISLNAASLMAIGMSVGVLVTNSIVVLEAIAKHLDRTGDPHKAARNGAAEAFVPVLASAGTNMVVLFPLSIMGSLFGLVIRTFALTLLILTAVSLFVSFTLTPLLCAVLLKPRSGSKKGLLWRMENGWNRGMEAWLTRYRSFLGFLEKRRWAALGVVALVMAMLGHSVWLVGRMGTAGTADVDRGQVSVRLEFPTHYSLDRTRERVALVQQSLEGIPHLQHQLTRIGQVEGEMLEGVYLASVLLRFSDRPERAESIHDLVQQVRDRLPDLPDAMISITIPGMAGTGADLEMEIAGPEFERLDALALAARDLALSIPGVDDADTTVRPGKPELRVLPNRAVLAGLAIPPMSVGNVLRANIEGVEAGTFTLDARNYDIRVKLDERSGIDQWQSFAFPGAPGRPLPLDGLAHAEEQRIPVQIVRKNKERISMLTANLAPDLPLGTAVERLSEEIDRNGILPPGYRYEFVGMYELLQDAMEELGEAGLLAIILVILTLAAILESFRQPFLILITLPLTLIGVVWALAMTGNAMEIFVMMSAIMMMGIVVNNAILIMDQFNIYVRNEGMHRHKAMIQAASERFRPVVMITVAAVLGMLPMALSRAIGAELRNAAGVASVGGILVSGVLTLIVLPVLYDLFTRKERKNT